jgi:hypothetical protein
MAAKKLKPLKWISTIPKESQFLWLVGLLECTGSFMCGRPSQPRTPRIEVAGSDPVTLTTLACLLDINVENSSRGSSTTLGGKRAIAIMLRLHAFLGPKRQDQITGVVTAYARVLGSRSKTWTTSFLLRSVGSSTVYEALPMTRPGVIGMESQWRWCKMDEPEVDLTYVAKLEGALVVLERSYSELHALSLRLADEVGRCSGELARVRAGQEEILYVITTPDDQIWDFRGNTELS